MIREKMAELGYASYFVNWCPTCSTSSKEETRRHITDLVKHEVLGTVAECPKCGSLWPRVYQKVQVND